MNIPLFFRLTNGWVAQFESYCISVLNISIFFFTFPVRHFDWYALRLFFLHQTAQVVSRQVQEVGLHTQEVRIDEVAEKKSCATGSGNTFKAQEKQRERNIYNFSFRISFSATSSTPGVQ